MPTVCNRRYFYLKNSIVKFLKMVLTNSGNGDIITMLENKFDLFLRNKLTKLIFKISDKNCKNEKIVRRQK